MELLTLLMRIPSTTTVIMILLTIFILLSKKVSLDKFYKIRKILCIVRWIANFIAILGICYFKFYDIARSMSGIMLCCAIEDVIFLSFLKNLISKNKGE